MLTVTFDEYNRMPKALRELINEWTVRCGYDRRGDLIEVATDDGAAVVLTYGTDYNPEVRWSSRFAVNAIAPVPFPVDAVKEWRAEPMRVTLDEYHRMPGFVRDAIDEWVNACGYETERGLIAVAVGDDASNVELTYGSSEPNRVTQRIDWATNPVTVVKTVPFPFPVDTVAEWQTLGVVE